MSSPRILMMCKGNIGDLVCYTPLLGALRAQLPQAWIGVLGTTYNAAVLTANPDIDALYCYQKAKHRTQGESLLQNYLQRLQLILTLRRQKIDWLLLPSGPQASALRFARWVAPRRIVVREGNMGRTHEVTAAGALLAAMGLLEDLPPLRVLADPTLRAAAQQEMANTLPPGLQKWVGVHVSSRKPSQRWSAEKFIALIQALASKFPHWGYLLFWSPGADDNPLHPGDDAKAQQILAATTGLPIAPLPTTRLESLIAGLDLCDLLICSDGGAMHVAAGLGKPIVCLFGNSPATWWHPWGVPCQLLQKPTREVEDICVADLLAAVDRLLEILPDPGQRHPPVMRSPS
jgi:heptosyltransferase-3